MTPFNILLGINILVIIFFLIQFLKNRKENKIKDDELQLKFKKELKRVSEGLSSLKLQNQEKMQSYAAELEKISNDYNVKKSEKESNFQALEQEHQRKLKYLKQSFESRYEQLEETKQNQLITHQNKLNAELIELEKKFKENKEAIEISFKAYCEEFEKKKEILTQEIAEHEKNQLEIINRFKLDEKIKDKVDFHRIVIDNIAEEDITKLKSLAETLHKPIILYKLIYEVFYKVKAEEMFKRVLGEKTKSGGIYKITNIKNNKVYIGKAVDFLARWRLHAKRGLRADDQTANCLYQFMWEDGLQNFTFEVIEICTKEEQVEREKFWIRFYHSNEYGYNMRIG